MTAPVTVDDVAALLGLELTGEQRRAVGAGLAPGVIVAGAGSGKTAVMAARVVYLVGSGQVRPDQVLGLTFTNKAAGELAARVRAAIAALRQTQWAPVTDVGDEPTVSTYNAYAGRLVADHGLRIGVEPSSRVITRAQQWQLATRGVRAHRGAISHLQIQPRSVVARVLELAAQLADHLVAPEDVRAEDARLRARIVAIADPDKGVLEVLDCLSRRDELLPFVEAFHRLKQERDLIDFGDQVAYAAQVAEQRPEVGEIERGRYAVVLLDEYQDTGVAQRRMLQALYADGHPVTAVGDPCQSIYGWRGASVGNLVHFPEHFPRADGQPTRVHYLTTNFRSGGQVLSLANAISASLRDSSAAVHVPELRPHAGAEGAGEVVAALLPTVEDEAAWVADGVVQALDRGFPLREIAVLARKRSQFDAIRRALEARDVPVEIVGLGGLLDTPEVNDLVSVLELLDDPTSNAALVRLLTGPRWRIGPRDLAALGSRAGQLARWPVADDAPADPLGDALRDADIADIGSLLDALDSLGDPARYSPEAHDRFRQLAAELHGLRQRAGQPLTDLIQDVERTIGLDVELMATPGLAGQGREANVAAFLDEAARFVGPDRESDLAAFLAYLQSAREQEAGLDIGVPTPADTVKLLTVHAAKGLEWDVVFVPGLAAGRKSSVFPSPSTLTGWITAPDQLPYPLRGDRDDLPVWSDLTKAGRQAFLEACRDRDEVEERRLAYVAFTRARSALHLSGYHWGATQTTAFGPSTYLTEAAADPAASIEQWAPPPPDGAANPLAGRVVDVPWPVPLDSAASAALTAGAADVRRRLADAGSATGADGPDPARPAAVSPADVAAIGRWEQEVDVLLAELAALPGSLRTAVLPAEISVSTVVDLQRAPAELAQRLARPLPQRPAPAARRGTAFHAWVEARGGQRQLLGPDDLPGAADDALGDTDLAELQAHFLRTDYAARVPVEVEVPFEMTVGGHLVRGRIDAVYADDDGGFDVIDYKTGRAPAGADAAAAAIQLSCYRLAWAALAGAPVDQVRAGFLYVADERVVRPAHLHDKEELAALLTALPTGRP